MGNVCSHPHANARTLPVMDSDDEELEGPKPTLIHKTANKRQFFKAQDKYNIKEQTNDAPAAMLRAVDTKWLFEWTDKHDLWDLTTDDVVTKIIKPATASLKCRFVELPDMPKQAVGEISMFISHAWKGRWGDLVTAVNHWVSEKRFVWVDIFAVNQHPGMEQKSDLEQLELLVAVAPQGTLLIVNPLLRISPLDRVWCLFEIFLTCKAKNPLLARVGQRNKRVFQVFAGGREFRQWDNAVSKLDLRNADAFKKSDKERIFDLVKKDVGFARLNKMVKNVLEASFFAGSLASVSYAVFNTVDKLKDCMNEAEPLIGTTGLQCMAMAGWLNPLKRMIAAGVDLDAKDREYATALGLAARYGNAECIRALLNAKAALEPKDDMGFTPFLVASYNCRMDCMKMLIEAGCNRNARNKRGQSAYNVIKYAYENPRRGRTDMKGEPILEGDVLRAWELINSK